MINHTAGENLSWGFQTGVLKPSLVPYFLCNSQLHQKYSSWNAYFPRPCFQQVLPSAFWRATTHSKPKLRINKSREWHQNGEATYETLIDSRAHLCELPCQKRTSHNHLWYDPVPVRPPPPDTLWGPPVLAWHSCTATPVCSYIDTAIFMVGLL